MHVHHAHSWTFRETLSARPGNSNCMCVGRVRMCRTRWNSLFANDLPKIIKKTSEKDKNLRNRKPSLRILLVDNEQIAAKRLEK